MNTILKITTGFTALLGLMALGCARPESTQLTTPAAPAKAVEVKLTKPSRQKLVRTISQPAQVLPYEEAVIHAKVTGYVQQVFVDIGDKVKGPVLDANGSELKPGSKLIRLDVPELIEDLNHRKALEKLASDEVALKKNMEKVSQTHIESAQANMQEAKASILRTNANLERWKSENERIAKLVSGKVLDEQTGDETLNQFKSAQSLQEETAARVKQARAKLDRAEAELEQSKSETLVAQSKLMVSKAETRKMEAMVRYTQINAPFDGIITQRKVDPGRLVHEDSANKGDALFTVAKMDPVRLFIEVPEQDSPLVHDGAEAKVTLQAFSGKEFSGKVTRTSWALNMASRTLRAEIDIPNKDLTIRPGMFANARILAILPECVVLPTTALVRSADGAFAFVVEDGKAKRVDVRLGRVEGDLAEVTGMRANPAETTWQEVPLTMEFIASGATTLAPGQAVMTAKPDSK